MARSRGCPVGSWLRRGPHEVGPVDGEDRPPLVQESEVLVQCWTPERWRAARFQAETYRFHVGSDLIISIHILLSIVYNSEALGFQP